MAHDITCYTRHDYYFTTRAPCTLYHMLLYRNYFHGAVASLKEGHVVLATWQNMDEDGASIDSTSTTTMTTLVYRVHTLNADDTQCCPCFTAMVYFHFYHTWLSRRLGYRSCCRRERSSVLVRFAGLYILFIVLFIE